MCVCVRVRVWWAVGEVKADIYVFKAQVAKKPSQQRRDMGDLLQEMGS